MWLNPDYAPRLLWDTSMGQDSSKGAEVRDVMAKAFKVKQLTAFFSDCPTLGSSPCLEHHSRGLDVFITSYSSRT